jgi:cell fate (sporulation/competence/biofilm development) regulator YlbF (YheA/YmcA/DUF963 family)
VDIIELARELGAKIQEDERYLNLKIASQVNDSDENLQTLINEFNLKRINVSNELSKSTHDDEKIRLLNEDLQKCYNEIMKNENMINYNRAKADFDELMRRINAIIVGCANGENPRTVDVLKSECSGNCSGCAGCH